MTGNGKNKMEIENVVNCALSVQINDSEGLSTISNLYFKKRFLTIACNSQINVASLQPSRNHHTYIQVAGRHFNLHVPNIPQSLLPTTKSISLLILLTTSSNSPSLKLET